MSLIVRELSLASGPIARYVMPHSEFHCSKRTNARTSLAKSLLPAVSDLGVFGKSLVDGDGGSGSDLALVGTFFVVVLVGTFASQVTGLFGAVD